MTLVSSSSRTESPTNLMETNTIPLPRNSTSSSDDRMGVMERNDARPPETGFMTKRMGRSEWNQIIMSRQKAAGGVHLEGAFPPFSLGTAREEGVKWWRQTACASSHQPFWTKQVLVCGG